MNIVKAKNSDIVVVGSEAEYRSLPYDSYSTLKELAGSPLGYYKKFVEKVSKYTRSEDAIRGSLTDCLLFTPEQFGDRFVVSTVTPPSPTTNMGKFVDKLVELTMKHSNEDGVVVASFEDLSLMAYNAVKYDYNGTEVAFKKESYEQVIEKFVDSTAEKYYQEQRAALTKTLVTQGMVQNAESLISTLLHHRNTEWLFYNQHGKYAQVQVQFFVDSLPLKSMIDYIVVDHFARKIHVYDLKVTWEVLSFHNNYLKNKYYLQAGLYSKAIKIWAEANFPGYSIDGFNFLLCHSPNQLAPKIIRLNEVDIKKAQEGFFSKGYYYIGVDELIADLIWHKETGNYYERRLEFENRGIVDLNLSYE